ncbi:MAG: hypothetical protein CSB28_00285 [Desulfobacterales bacterium]|nr:MAG: hypothetical protein CSB28_00285 [Desulfobacterales bacterium]
MWRKCSPFFHAFSNKIENYARAYFCHSAQHSTLVKFQYQILLISFANKGQFGYIRIKNGDHP